MNPLFSKHTPHKNGERGQAIIIIVFAIIGLIGMTSLAIDGGNALIDRRRTETAASAAALTAALIRIEGGDWRSAALATARANGYNNDGITNIIEMNTPPLSGPYAGNSEHIEVIITSHLDTYFGPVIGVPKVTNVARAVTQTKPAEYGEMFDGYALVSLAPHSKCEIEGERKSFWIHNEITVSLTGGGIFVNSDNPDCAFIQFGSGSVRVKDESPITIVGGTQIQKPKLITPYPVQTGAVPIAYPPAMKMPKIGCGNKVATVDELTGTSMSSGSWGGDETFPPKGVTNLESGIYCISGDVVIEAGAPLTGDGVLLIMEDGEFLVDGNAHVSLSAPKNGTAKGLLIYMPIKNIGRVALNGDSGSSFRGTIFAPGGDVRLNGMDGREGFHSQIIGYTIEVDGQGNIPIKYRDEDNYDAYKMPEVLLSQ